MFFQTQKSSYKHTFICLTVWIAGGILSLFANISIKENNLNSNLDFPSLIPIGLNFVFPSILINNLIIGLISSLLGFITGGFLTIAIFLWNGFLLGLILRGLLASGGSLHLIFLHGSVEIWAFCLFGSIGLRSIYFYKGLLVHKVFSSELLPQPREFIMPIILLTIAASLEAIIIELI